jgi:hypothetical protein
MALPINSYEIFDLLAADSDLSAMIGVHNLRDGSTRPALAHLFPNESIEATTSTSGVEIIVYRSPQGTMTKAAETGEISVNPTFRLSVIQWEPGTGGFKQDDVINRILFLLPGANAADVTIDDLTAGLQQHTITWTANSAMLIP